MSSGCIAAREIAREWLKDPEFRAEYEALEGEFALASALIEARGRAGMTQTQVAKAMGTTQAAIARLEGGRVKPSTRTLERFAKFHGHPPAHPLRAQPSARVICAAVLSARPMSRASLRWSRRLGLLPSKYRTIGSQSPAGQNRRTLSRMTAAHWETNSGILLEYFPPVSSHASAYPMALQGIEDRTLSHGRLALHRRVA
jgi:transcriptional regulator with XRE-family HTH domain